MTPETSVTRGQRPRRGDVRYSLFLLIASVALCWAVACAYVVADGYLGTVSLSFPTPLNLAIGAAILWAGVAIARRLTGRRERRSKAAWPLIAVGLVVWGWATAAIVYEAVL